MSGVVSKMSGLFNEKLVQISLVSAVLFYIVANPMLFDFVDNSLKSLFTAVGASFNIGEQGLLIVHSLLYAVLLGLTVKFLMEPLLAMRGNGSVRTASA
jgi:hypothetical protein